MKLINFPYANCHLLCLINIAAMLDKNFKNAFSTLWTETDFADNAKYQIYISKRVFKNFKAMGIKIKPQSYNLIADKSFLIIGMDTFYIPWSPVYQNFHGNHYFIVQKDNADFLYCFDPIYNKKNVKIKTKDVKAHAFDICSVTKTLAKPWSFKIENQAKKVLCNSSKIQKQLCAQIKSQNLKNFSPAIKQIIALTCNRYMFKSFLQQSYPQFSNFFNKDFFEKWHAVKNGLHKASIAKDNTAIIDEVDNMLKNLLKQEYNIANKIIKKLSQAVT